MDKTISFTVTLSEDRYKSLETVAKLYSYWIEPTDVGDVVGMIFEADCEVEEPLLDYIGQVQREIIENQKLEETLYRCESCGTTTPDVYLRDDEGPVCVENMVVQCDGCRQVNVEDSITHLP